MKPNAREMALEAGKGKGSADLPSGCIFSLNLENFWCGVFW